MRLDTQVFAINVSWISWSKPICFAFTSATSLRKTIPFIAQCRLGASPEQIFHTNTIRSKNYRQIKSTRCVIAGRLFRWLPLVIITRVSRTQMPKKCLDLVDISQACFMLSALFKIKKLNFPDWYRFHRTQWWKSLSSMNTCSLIIDTCQLSHR